MTTSRYTQPGCVTIHRITGILALVIASVFLTAGVLRVGDAGTTPSRKQMSQDQLIKLALSAAPAHIAKDAAVMVQGEDGKLVEARKGTNGFTCVPMADPNVPTLDPMCMDQAAFQWFTSLMNKAQTGQHRSRYYVYGKGSTWLGQGWQTAPQKGGGSQAGAFSTALDDLLAV